MVQIWQPRLREGRDLLKVTQLGIFIMLLLLTQTTCSVPGTILSALYVLTHLILTTALCEGDSVFAIPTLGIREMRQLVRRSMACKCWSWDLNLSHVA